MKDHNRYDNSKLQDYIVMCDTCGAPFWKSQMTLLKPDTGLGGSLVCPRDADIKDWGLVPYKIRAESAVPGTRVNNLSSPTDFTQTYQPITDFNTVNLDVWPIVYYQPSTQTIDTENLQTIDTTTTYTIGS